MSIRIRLLLSYIAMVIIPIVFCGIAIMLISVTLFGDIRIAKAIIGLNQNSHSLIDKEQEGAIRTKEDEDDIFSRLKILSSYAPDKLEDLNFLKETDKELNDNQAGLLIRKNDELTYSSPYFKISSFDKYLPAFETEGQRKGMDVKIEGNSFYYKQFDYYDEERDKVSIFVFEHVNPLEEIIREFSPYFVFMLILGLIITNGILTYFISRSIIKPLHSLKQATERIQKGDLDFQVKRLAKDEIGELSLSFEEMRGRLKESVELQMQYEKNRKELLSNISHDLRTPITAIKGYVQGIKEGIARTPEQLDKYLTIIYNKVFDMDQLIDELFLFSKLDLKEEPFQFEEVEINQYLSDCIEELQLELQDKGITVRCDAQKDTSILVKGDREKLRRVITNIIWNSVKYMDKEEGYIGIRMTESSDYVTIYIKDNGIGIEEKALPHIFKRFYRADHSRNSNTGGSGLGLSIAHQIITQHGGDIWVESKKGKGTTLAFTLQKIN